MKLLEVGQVLDINPRIKANKLIELGNDRLEGMAWINDKFEEINKKLMQSQKGGMRLLNNPQLIKMADQFAEFYVVFMQNSEKFFDDADDYVNDTDASSDLPDDMYDQLDALLITNTQQKLKFTQLDLENMFDLVSTKMTPNMTKAISQRANKHFKNIIKNESVYGNFWGRSRTQSYTSIQHRKVCN